MEIFWTAIAAVAASVAAAFAGLAWCEARKSRRYIETKEAPDLWLVKDKFVYGDYQIAEDESTPYNQPKDIPPKTAILRNFSIIDNSTKERLNRICIILNSSSTGSSSSKINNFTGLFGEIYFENRGTLGIKKIKIIDMSFKMNKTYGYDVEDFKLETVGEIDVDISRGFPFVAFIGYLYNEGAHMLCDPKYVEDSHLREDAMRKKRNYDNQLSCHLPVIIDLYDEVSFTFEYVAQNEVTYTQTQTVKIERDECGGWYKPKPEPAKIKS